jgi:SpoVK/Ycf46/Vps4 family AAA+-type ATPase
MIEIAEALVPSERREVIRNNVIHSALQFTGKVVGADGRFVELESSFLNEIGFTPDDSVLDNLEYVRRCKANWDAFRFHVPEFIGIAITHDKESGTRHAASLVNHLEKLGLLAAACDGNSKAAELTIIVEYINFLRRTLVSRGVETKAIEKEKPKEPVETLEDLRDRLNALVGLAAVKQEIETAMNLVRVRQMRKEHGLKVPPLSMHMVFTGNPGTGKTTVARLLSSIYRALGVLEKGHLVEVDRSGLVGGYLGQTALKVQDVVKSALGGILFIDEAYALATTANSNQDSYGREAIDTLVKLMEDHREKLVVIVAGYTKPMEQFLDANVGLRSRFNKFVHFEDYRAQDLYEIFLRLCTEQNFTYDEETGRCIHARLEALWEKRDGNFGNARSVRNFFERSVSNQANRLASISNVSQSDLFTLISKDIPS